MGWVRVSDDFYDHEKFENVSGLGVGLWIAGLAHANRNLTDGFVSVRAVGGLVSTHGLGLFTGNFSGKDADPEDGADELVSAGLWHASGHGCETCPQPRKREFYIHDYLSYQPSKNEVEAKREDVRRRVEKHRNAGGNTGGNTGGNAVTNGVSTRRPNPNPKENKLTTNPPVVDARAEDDSVINPVLAAVVGAVRAHGLDMSPLAAPSVVEFIDSRRRRGSDAPRVPTRYYPQAIDQSWPEVEKFIHEEGLAS